VGEWAVAVTEDVEEVKIGYHARPSLVPLHIHIISTDLESDKLKSRKHFNSFATSFFVPIDLMETWVREGDVGRELDKPGYWQEMIDGAMVCPICGSSKKTISKMKEHHKICQIAQLKMKQRNCETKT